MLVQGCASLGKRLLDDVRCFHTLLLIAPCAGYFLAHGQISISSGVCSLLPLEMLHRRVEIENKISPENTLLF
jgi:hypothetical protein